MENYSSQQLTVQLETHLNDPIIGIKLYDASGKLLVDVGKDTVRISGMMNNHMMNRMMGAPAEEIDSAEITDNGILLGQLDVIRYSSIGNSLQTRMFVVALIGNSFISFAIVVCLMLIIGSVVSRRMSERSEKYCRSCNQYRFG